MKKFYLAAWSLLLLAPFTSACSRDEQSGAGETGSFRLTLAADHTVITGGQPSRQGGEDIEGIDVNSFAVSISKYEETLYQWNTYVEMQEAGEPELRPSTYTLRAWQGDVRQEGFEKPSFSGSSDLVIRKGETTPVAVTCYLANAKLKIAYTETFKKYFETYSALVETSLENTVEYVQDETRFAYFAPGKLVVKARVKKSGQSQEAVYKVKEIDAQPRHAYTLTLDVDAGSATMTVEFSEETSNPDEQREFDVSDAALNAPAPYFKAKGFSTEEVLNMPEGNVGSEISAYLNAVAQIASCKLSTTSDYLIGKGWPAEVDLTAPGEHDGKLKEFHLETRGLTGNVSQMAWVNFTHLLAGIPAAAGETHQFTLMATDQYGKTSAHPLRLQATLTEGGKVTITPVEEAVPFLSESCKMKVSFESDYPGYQGNPELIQFYMGEDKEAPMTCTDLVSEDGKTFIATLQAPPGVKFMEPFKVSGDYLERRLESEPTQVSYGVLVMEEGETWATKTYVHLFNATMEDIRLQYKDASGWSDFTEVSQLAAHQPGKGILLQGKGLKPQTDYTIRAVKKQGAEAPTNECKIRTEEARQVANPGFEEWYSEKLYSQNVLWAKNTIYGFYFWKQGATEEERGWDTTNPLTTPDPGGSSVWDYRSAAGVVPTANKEETASYHLKRYGGQDLATEGHQGNAAEIATVGWGAGDTWTSSSSQPSNRTAGQLYIGNYGNPIQYGKAFASRPSAVRFWYKYYSYNNESTTPYIELFDENHERIGYGALKIASSVNTFTQGEISVEYTSLKKAHSFTIVFPSTDSPSPATRGVGGGSGAFSGYLDSRHIGSILTVDDIELVYE